jgi:pimeloyl-ACP methyl ester carboxylesterase
VIHGTEDLAISTDKAEALCAGLAGCVGLVRIEGGSHASNLSHPDVVNAALRDFLLGLEKWLKSRTGTS